MKLTGFHIEPTNRCVLKCSACERTQFLEQFGSKAWQQSDINLEHLQSFIDIDVKHTLWELCGNTGDPIYYPNLIELASWIKDQGGNIYMTTNGSYRKHTWWAQLLEVLDNNDTIVFSVDGSPNTSPIYRINSDWLSIDMAMDMVSKSKVAGIWKMIPFNFNEHEIKFVKTMSADRGLGFRLDPSERFEKDDPLLPSKEELKTVYGQGAMAPRCSDGTRHYISAKGYYTPCCWMARYSFYYKSDFYKQQEQFDISKTTFSQVISNLSDFYSTIEQEKHSYCTFNCPKI